MTLYWSPSKVYLSDRSRRTNTTNREVRLVAIRVDAPLLSKPERVFLWRRRRGLRQPEAAAHAGVDVEQWREWETGDGENIPRHVGSGLGKVERWEMMTLWRRRARWSIKEAALRMGISHVTLIARERGEGEWEETFDWWEQNGWNITSEQVSERIPA